MLKNLMTTIDIVAARSLVDQAVEDGKIAGTARENILAWLEQPRYAEYRDSVLEHIHDERWQILDDVFWTIIPFGTGGRRGRMYPIGSNAINERTIGESAAGLASYVKQQEPGNGELSCAIAYDTRHNSPEFAALCARIMVAAGFRVYLLDNYRSTPELSFLVRHKRCSCGIMVTASHNPPSDNAVKVYWSTGGQILPPHDSGVIEAVMSTDQLEMGDSFESGIAAGSIVVCTAETDAAYVPAVVSQGFDGPRDLKILYTPLHGVGASAVCPVLAADGFEDVEVFGPHAELDGNFPNVPDHVSNPENPAVFDSVIRRAREIGADLILATDPDCDRLGAAAPLTTDPTADWATFNGNQLGALLADYVLEQRASHLTPKHYVVKTLVTTEMVRRIADSYRVATQGDLLVGFKWIGGVIDDVGPDKFVFGTEESHGYLVGQYARDKCGAVASMLMSELAARVKAAGLSLHDKLDALYWQHGYHAERLMTQKMPGSEGMARMQALMTRLREQPPAEIAGLKVSGVRDYLHGRTILPDGSAQPLAGPTGNIIIIDLDEPGNYVAARPSGTEPKVKFYMFTYVAPEMLADMQLARDEMQQRLDGMQTSLSEIAEAD